MNQHTKNTIVVKSPIGKVVYTFLEELLTELHNNPQFEKIQSEVNHVLVTADKETTFEELRSQYLRKRKGYEKRARMAKGRKVSKVKAKQQKRQTRKEQTQLLREFNRMDKIKVDELVSWLRKSVPYTYNRSFPRYEIASRLKEYGYMANENVDDNFLKGHKINEARWIIGQFISFLQRGKAMNDIIEKFILEWEDNYLAA